VVIGAREQQGRVTGVRAGWREGLVGWWGKGGGGGGRRRVKAGKGDWEWG
jgi:hypothetical protein